MQLREWGMGLVEWVEDLLAFEVFNPLAHLASCWCVIS